METMRLSIGNPLIINGFMIYKSYTILIVLMTPSPYYISKQRVVYREITGNFRFEIMGVERPQALDIWMFPKMVGFPDKPMGFPTKNDHFGSFWGVLAWMFSVAEHRPKDLMSSSGKSQLITELKKFQQLRLQLPKIDIGLSEKKTNSQKMVDPSNRVFFKLYWFKKEISGHTLQGINISHQTGKGARSSTQNAILGGYVNFFGG